MFSNNAERKYEKNHKSTELDFKITSIFKIILSLYYILKTRRF